MPLAPTRFKKVWPRSRCRLRRRFLPSSKEGPISQSNRCCKDQKRTGSQSFSRSRKATAPSARWRCAIVGSVANGRRLSLCHSRTCATISQVSRSHSRWRRWIRPLSTRSSIVRRARGGATIPIRCSTRQRRGPKRKRRRSARSSDLLMEPYSSLSRSSYWCPSRRAKPRCRCSRYAMPT